MKRHLSRLNIPKSWPVERKKTKWITRPSPGPHNFNRSIPLNVLLKEVLGYASTTKEVKTILNKGVVKINSKVRKNHRFPVGLMDIISIGKDNYQILLNKKGEFDLHKITREEANSKPRKIVQKTLLKKNKIQLNFLDGTNKILDKDEYSVSDTVIFDLEKNEIKGKIELKEGNLIYLIGGKYIGEIGLLKKIGGNSSTHRDRIIFSRENKDFETSKKYAFAIGKNKPIINVKK